MVLLYYFLIKFANPAIVPWVHTTMFYNLYEDTGLAYLHTEFDEHRAYLEGRLREGKPVGYFPESADWVAFDIKPRGDVLPDAEGAAPRVARRAVR